MKKIIKEAKIDIKKYGVSYEKRNKTFSVEVSQLKGLSGALQNNVILYNPDTKGQMEFKIDGVDKYGSDEDEEIAGWRFKSRDGKYHLLIIND